MSIVRPFIFAVVSLGGGAYEHLLRAQAGADSSSLAVATVVSADARLRKPIAGLRIVIRDADAPDQPIDQAYIVVSRLSSNAPAGPPLGTISNDRGVVVATRLDSGEYFVRVRRVGYHEARFTIRLRPSCEQILEVYIAQSVVQFDRCQVRTVVSPPCDPDPAPTPSRAVLTTCARAA
jgi:hypothetical protein